MDFNTNSNKFKLCKQYDSYMVGIDDKLYSLAQYETELRLKTLIHAILDPVDELHRIYGITASYSSYKYPSSAFNTFLTESKKLITKLCNKGINFDRVKKEKNKKDIYDIYKNKWFHNCPKLITKQLWIPTLIDLSKYYNDIALSLSSTLIIKQMNARQMQQFLKKRFVKNLFEIKCQMNYLANPSGPIIQYSCWRLPSLHNILINYFDANDYKFQHWLNLKQSKSAKSRNLRIPEIVKKYIKPHAQNQYESFIHTMNMHDEHKQFEMNKNKKYEINDILSSNTLSSAINTDNKDNNDNQSYSSGTTAVTAAATAAATARTTATQTAGLNEPYLYGSNVRTQTTISDTTQRDSVLSLNNEYMINPYHGTNSLTCYCYQCVQNQQTRNQNQYNTIYGSNINRSRIFQQNGNFNNLNASLHRRQYEQQRDFNRILRKENLEKHNYSMRQNYFANNINNQTASCMNGNTHLFDAMNNNNCNCQCNSIRHNPFKDSTRYECGSCI